jgi:hypothetical protein
MGEMIWGLDPAGVRNINALRIIETGFKVWCWTLTHLHIATRIRRSKAVSALPLNAFVAWTVTTFALSYKILTAIVAVMNSGAADPSFDDKLLCVWIGPCLCCGSARMNHCKKENMLEWQGPFSKEAFNKCFFKLDFSAAAKTLVDEKQLMKLLNECELIGPSEVINISMPVMNCTFHSVPCTTWLVGRS